MIFGISIEKIASKAKLSYVKKINSKVAVKQIQYFRKYFFNSPKIAVVTDVKTLF